MNRRNFLRQCATSGLALYGFKLTTPFLALPEARAASVLNPAPGSVSPIQNIGGAFVSGQFNGDDISRPHDLLWDVEGYIRRKGGKPDATETANFAIVGGGISGLLSAHFLREFSPVIFEQAPSLGGNSKGERYRGDVFSIGAAYIGVPEAGGEIENLLKELNLAGVLKRELPDEVKVSIPASGLKRLWQGETDPARRAEILKVKEELARIYEKAYPEIPWVDGSDLSREEFDSLDKQTAQAWLDKKFPGLHPHLAEYFQVYCWSSLGGSLEELSAAQFLNFICAEMAGVATLPGGNSTIAEGLYTSLTRELGPERIKCGSIVLEVKNTGDGVEILYEDGQGTLRRLKAKGAIVAAPKYVARYIVKDLSAERNEAWKGLPYRAYAVANVLLKEKVPSAAFDIFGLEGKVPERPTFGARTDRPWADFVFSGWANRGDAESSILTLYKPFPFDGARSLISSDIAFKRIQEEIEKELPKTLQSLGLRGDSIAGIRITRWGHSIPLAQPGMASREWSELLGAPLGKIAFANQDNFVSPAFESCFAAAKAAAAYLKKFA